MPPRTEEDEGQQQLASKGMFEEPTLRSSPDGLPISRPLKLGIREDDRGAELDEAERRRFLTGTAAGGKTLRASTGVLGTETRKGEFPAAPWGWGCSSPELAVQV